MMPLLDDYQFVTPASLADALADLSRHPGARPFAGGTDLMVVMEAGQLPPGRYISLQHCRELRGIRPAADGGVDIGALTTYTEIREAETLAQTYGMLRLAARETGGIATQNRGTIGGNIANASPAADTPPVLLVYDAALELVSVRGARRIVYKDFHRGYKQMALASDELIARIHLPPRSAGWKDYYRKVGTRRAQAISKVCVAGATRVDGDRVADIRVALGSVAPTVIRATRTEDLLRGSALMPDTIARAQQTLLSEVTPIDDIRSSARYRGRVAANLLRELLTQ